MITPDEIAFVRDPAVGAATYGAERRCQYCGKRAELFDVDGAWCSPECREYDRQSEITIWRRWEQ